MLMFIAQAVSFCTTDADCLVRSRSDIHSLYCVNNTCQKLLSAGKNCVRPTDCASYFYYGPLACSARCRAESECEYDELKSINSVYCCRAVPEGKECNAERPNLLNGCESKHACVQTDGMYRCMGRNVGAWSLGVYLSIQGNLCINIGLNLQKRSYHSPYLTIRDVNLSMFYIGVMVYVLGKISGFMSYIFGNQSLLASLGAVGLIANSVFAPLINGEVFTWKDFMAIIFVLSGSSVILMNSGRSHKTFTLCELLKMYQKKETIIWFLIILALILVLFLLVKFVEVNSEWSFTDDIFDFMKRDRVYFEETGRILKYSMVILYVSLSGIIASFTTLFAKSFGEMIDQTLLGDNQFFYGITYLFFANIVLFTGLQIFWMNKALRHYDALLVIPLFFVIWTLFSVVTAAVYFRDFEYYTLDQFKGFVYGLMIILAGSFFLASRVMNSDRVVGRESDVRKMPKMKKDGGTE